MILRTLVSRGFLAPSHHYIPCRKEELLLETGWGRVQIWREHVDPLGGKARQPEIYFLRFLGSRGRAEMATLDPADRLVDRAAEVWTMNPPAFGGTTGPADLERYADCTLATVDHLCKLAAGAPVWVCGKSIGTTAALLAVAHGGANAAVLRNAMPLHELLRRHYLWRTLGLSRFAVAPMIPKRLDSVVNAGKASVPALFVVSREDRVVPPRYQQDVISAYRGSAAVLEVAGGHDERSLRPEDEVAYRRALRLLASTPSSSRPAPGAGR